MNKRNFQKELDALIQNIQKERVGESAPTLLLHSCCAPCSSYTLEYLSQYFRITVLYFNPNIMRKAEYEKRVAEQQRLIEALNLNLNPNPNPNPNVNPNHEPQNTCRARISEPPSHGTEPPSHGQGQSQGQSPLPISHHPLASVEDRTITFLPGRYEPREFVDAVRGMEEEPEGGKRCWVCYELRLEEAAKIAKEGGYDYFCTTLSISPLKHADWLNEIGEKLSEKYDVKWLPSDFKKKGGYKRSIELSREYDLYRQNFCGCEYSRR